jgi:hypothetical protein
MRASAEQIPIFVTVSIQSTVAGRPPTAPIRDNRQHPGGQKKLVIAFHGVLNSLPGGVRGRTTCNRENSALRRHCRRRMAPITSSSLGAKEAIRASFEGSAGLKCRDVRPRRAISSPLRSVEEMPELWDSRLPQPRAVCDAERNLVANCRHRRTRSGGRTALSARRRVRSAGMGGELDDPTADASGRAQEAGVGPASALKQRGRQHTTSSTAQNFDAQNVLSRRGGGASRHSISRFGKRGNRGRSPLIGSSPRYAECEHGRAAVSCQLAGTRAGARIDGRGAMR